MVQSRLGCTSKHCSLDREPYAPKEKRNKTQSRLSCEQTTKSITPADNSLISYPSPSFLSRSTHPGVGLVLGLLLSLYNLRKRYSSPSQSRTLDKVKQREEIISALRLVNGHVSHDMKFLWMALASPSASFPISTNLSDPLKNSVLGRHLFSL